MLQRAASNAYSWWWASHIRTKQSKWLEENLQDMEDKINDMLKIIENDGDSFAQRAEMYYRRRPELINQVEETYRAYRALAERYDKLSKDLQSANRTIATVFPEQVHLMDDDDGVEDEEEEAADKETESQRAFESHYSNIPKVPSEAIKEYKSFTVVPSQKERPAKNVSMKRAVTAPRLGLSEEEALEEIGKLQKEILGLQTEKEFIESVSKRYQEKSSGIENQIACLQDKIGNLQDEFGHECAIDDDEARALMAATALKSCKESLAELQHAQRKSAVDSEVENQRIDEAQKNFQAFRSRFMPEEKDEESHPTNQSEADMEVLRQRIKQDLETELSSSATVMQLAEKIDALVEKVVTLETAVSSQRAMVGRLRMETDELQEHVKTLEEDKETLMGNSEAMREKLAMVEEELTNVKLLNLDIKTQNHKLQENFAEASCNIDHLTEKLHRANTRDDSQKVSSEYERPVEEEEDGENTKKLIGIEGNEDDTSGTVQEHENISSNHLHGIESKPDMRTPETESNVDSEPEGEEQPNWKQLFMGGLEDREKHLLEEYTSVLRNYKDVRRKLGDVEKKNRDGFFELAMQIRELKNALSARDEEIKSLRRGSGGEGDHIHRYMEQSPESMQQAVSYVESNQSFLSSPRTVFDSIHDLRRMEGRERPAMSAAIPKYPVKESRMERKTRGGESPQRVHAIEAKIRSDMDELLEENLEFWLRFSTSFHQIRKFQTSVHDLKVELAKLKQFMQQNGAKMQVVSSEGRPIYKHFREIHTDLALWLENNLVLKDEIQNRYASLCAIQEEVSKMTATTCKGQEAEISEYQAAKFHGEILNMKQESSKVSGELLLGLDRVRGLKDEVERIMARMDEEMGILTARSPSRAKIPLRSFLFGVKLKKQKKQKHQPLFACANPALQKQYSDMAAAKRV